MICDLIGGGDTQHHDWISRQSPALTARYAPRARSSSGISDSRFPTASHPNDVALCGATSTVSFERVNSSGGPASGRIGGHEMAGPDSLLSASGGSAAADEFAYAEVARYEVRDRYLGAAEVRELHTSSTAVELTEGSLALQGEDHLDNPEQQEAEAAFRGPVWTGERFAEWSLRYALVLAGVDAFIGGLAAAIPALTSGALHAYQVVPLLCLIGLLFWPAVIGISRGYLSAQIGVGSDEFRAVMRAGTIMVVGCALPAGFLVVSNAAFSPNLAAASPLFALLSVLVLGAPIAVALSLLARVVARKVLHRLQREGRGTRRVIVAGSAGATQQLIERIQREQHDGMKIIGLCLPSEELPRPVVNGIPVLGSLDQVADVAYDFGCDAVAVTSDDVTRCNYVRELAWSLENAEVELLIDPGLEEVAGPRLHIRPFTGFPLIRVAKPQFAGWRRLIKRSIDVFLSVIGLVLTAPFMLIIAAVVKLQDRGPVMFRQIRVGRRGEPFTMIKFRSMVIDAEARKADLLPLSDGHGALFKLRDDPRITRFGRFLRAFSLDELPQLFNVLRGSMSLVGPRPHVAQELAQMPHQAGRRLLVTPGVTGLWQVSGRSDLDEQDGIRLDLRYVDNWSLTYDLQILWKTASAVLARRGAR
jgi:exopolysaccharide biosynthesis polyprenyl glycosylphosphotransferase